MVRASTRMFGERLVVTLRWVPAHLPETVRLLAHGGDTTEVVRAAAALLRADSRRALEQAAAPLRRVLG